MRKKISLLLVFFMLFTMLPMAGFAEEDVDFIGETLVEAVSPEEGTDPEAGEEASPGIEPGEEEPEVEPGPALEPEETEPEEDPEAEPLPGETVTEPEEEEVTLEPEIEEIEPEVRPEEVLAAPLAATFGLDEEPELSNNFYQLKSKEDLFWFAEKLNQSPDEKINGELLGDIDLENEKWTPIEKLNGEFNGNSYTIKNLLVEETTYSQGFIKENYGIVRNFTLEGSVTSNKHSLGAVAGKNFGIISDIENYAEIINNGSYSNAKYIGGIAGTNEGTIFRVSNYANIMIEGNIIGGIVGLEEGTIYSAANYGNIKSRTGFSDYAGGIVGAINMNKTSTIYNVFNQGKVEGGIKGKAGGVAGYLQSNAILSLSNAYNTGELTAAEKNPMSPGGTLNNTYYLSDETDWDSGKVSAEDFKKNEIIEKLNKDDNELEVNDKDKFVFTKDTYPTLRWQGMESPSTPEEPSEIKELREAAEGLKVTVKNTSTELPYLVTDSDWIKLIDHGPNNDYSIDVSWKSSNNDLISISSGIGSIKLPETGEAEVTLTATLSKSGYSLDKEFKYILTKNKPELSEDEIYLEEAIKSLEWYKLNTNSDKDENLTLFLKEVLNAKQYSDINVSIKSSSREDLVELDGKINYIFDEAYLKTGLPYDRKAELIFDFTKGEAKKEYSTFIMVDWDRSKVREAIERNIVDPLSQNLIGDNEAFDQIKVDFQVPGMREYTRITWETSDASFLRVEPGQLPIDPSNIKVIRGEVDKNLVLTAKVVYNRDDTIMVEKEYHFTILALNDANELVAEMQTLLDENYTLDKLKNYTNKEIIDANDIKDDISLIKPKDTGIKDYDNYKFEVTSDGDDILIKGFRAHVYRPLPGQNAKEATLTIKMIHKDKGVTVEKSIPIKISPLVQDDIDAEISLMELVKEKYFEAIKGENTDADSIESNLKAFREVNLVNGSLQWTYHIDDDKDTGIYADEIKGAESQEQWRLFRSSRPEIIKHENLIVYKPEYTTKVNIESALSSRQYGKYAEKYPDVDDFKKLYKQPVLITLTVIGENDEIKDEVKTLDVNTAIVVFKENGDYEIKSVPQEVKIEKDKHDGGLTVFGALQATTNEYIGSGSWVTSIYGITGPTTTGGWMFTVNGQVPEYPAGQVILKEGDKVIWYCTYDYQRDQAPSWEELTKTEPEEVTLDSIIASLRSHYAAKSEFAFREAIGYNYTSDNLENDLSLIAAKIKVKEAATTSSDLAGNVISIISAGQDPFSYQGVNYVEKLDQAFNKNDWPTSSAFRMLALDMAQADYNRVEAIKTFVDGQDDEGKWGGSYAGPDEVGMVITALAKYKDQAPVQEAIDKGLVYLKGAQDSDTGGFIVWGSENPYSASAVIQGLIAVGEDPSAEKWTKNGKSITDSLLSFYVDGKIVDDKGAEVPMLTEQAFIALADLQKGKSMFNEIKFGSGQDGKEQLTIKIISDKTSIKVDEQLELKAEVYQDNNLVTDKEIVWTSSDVAIANIDDNGLVTGKKQGEVSIRAAIEGTEIHKILALTVVGGGGSTTDPEKPTLQSVDILIKGYSGTILNKNNVKINENESLLNLTIRLLEENNISYENRNGYIASINGEKEFDKGKDSGWMVSVNGEFPQVGAASVILKDKDIVQWLYTYDLGEDIGGGTGGGGAAKPPTTAEPNLAPKVPVKEGSATATITTADINKAIEEIKKDSSKALVISPEITGQATKVSVEIAKESITAILNETKADLKVETPVGNLNIPQAALKEIAAAAGSNGIAITVESVETSKLTAEQKELVKESPVFDISIKTGDKNISSFNGKEITISLPYTLKADEKASDVKVWYLNDKGQLEEMKCTYDEKTGLATFTTNHLSKFMVGVEVAEVKPVPVATISFTDVSAADWFYDAVKFAVEKGLFKGTSENTFSPNQATTRAMVVSVLHRLSGEPAGYKSSFTDVNENDWFVEPVAWAAANNVVSGYGQGLFGPNDQVTREQLAGILHRYAQSKGYELTKTKDLSGYKDASAISPWAKEVIAWANAEGLINGRSADLLAPGESATRAEVAAILQRFIENIMK